MNMIFKNLMIGLFLLVLTYLFTQFVMPGLV
jgi:hypothetical protein